MPLPRSVSALISRPDLMSPVTPPTGSNVAMAPPGVYGLSNKAASGRPGLLLLGLGVIGLVAFSWWTR